MFEIWGTLKKDDIRNERLSKYFTKIFFDESDVPFVPPCFKMWEQFIHEKEYIIITFRYFRQHQAPYVTLSHLSQTLKDFSAVKHKAIVELSPMAEDFKIGTQISIPMNANHAQLKASLKGSRIFYDEHTACAYYTYTSDTPHLVWLENTKSLAEKHNLIKKAGFKGIYWRYPYALPEGNWETMYSVYNKRMLKKEQTAE